MLNSSSESQEEDNGVIKVDHDVRLNLDDVNTFAHSDFKQMEVMPGG